VAPWLVACAKAVAIASGPAVPPEPTFNGRMPALAACPPPGGTPDGGGVYFAESQVLYPAVVRYDGFGMSPAAIGGKGAGMVVVRFIVDTSGRAEPGSIQVVRSTVPSRDAAVLAAVPKLRFAPAWIGRGCRVRQLVEQKIEFR
jgi:TonB family protein